MFFSHAKKQATNALKINEPTVLLEYLDLSGSFIRNNDCSIRVFQYFCAYQTVQ